MIEVLVAVVVLVFGVLGMAGMQMQAVSATEQGRYSSRAAIQAASIATAIKANPGYWATSAASGTVTVTGSTVSGGPAAFTGSCVSGTVCTSAQLAYYDLVTVWGADVARWLPSGSISVNCDQTQMPAICTVTISWLEKNISGRSQAAGSGIFATGGSATHQYQTLVTPIQKTNV